MSLECISRFCYYLAKRIKVIYSMICSSLFPSVPLNARESKIGCISCVASMLLLLCYLSPFRRLYTCIHLRWKLLFSSGIHFRVANACDVDECSGLS